MEYTKWVMGEEKANELLETIKSRVSADDPEHLTSKIIDVEIEKIMDKTPVNFKKLERVMTGDLNPGNGQLVSGCIENLQEVRGFAKDDPLKQKNGIILSAVKYTYFGRVFVEIKSAIRQHIREQENDTSGSL